MPHVHERGKRHVTGFKSPAWADAPGATLVPGSEVDDPIYRGHWTHANRGHAKIAEWSRRYLLLNVGQDT